MSSLRTHPGRYLLVVPAVVVIWVALSAMTRSEPLVIGGDVVGRLTPGQMLPLDLTLTNPRGFPLSVSDLRVSVRTVHAPQADERHPCTRGDFAVTQPGKLDLLLPGDAARTLAALAVPKGDWPRVGMRDRSVNQDGCKNATLTLRFVATGTRER